MGNNDGWPLYAQCAPSRDTILAPLTNFIIQRWQQSIITCPCMCINGALSAGQYLRGGSQAALRQRAQGHQGARVRAENALVAERPQRALERRLVAARHRGAREAQALAHLCMQIDKGKGNEVGSNCDRGVWSVAVCSHFY